jgi:probable rRNA maturation factor
MKPDRPFRLALRRAVRLTLSEEAVTKPAIVRTAFIDEIGMAALNNRMRGTNKATDVLAFPSSAVNRDCKMAAGCEDIDPETGCYELGDIVICWPAVIRQAAELGHTAKYEMCYLAVHAALHLLGYDHTDEGPEKEKMRAKEKTVMEMLNVK